MLVAKQAWDLGRERAVKLSRDDLSASYAFCRQMARRAGSSFYLGFLLLPQQKRRAMDALYAFMRHTDDLVDAPHPDHPAADALVEWRAALDRALLGDFDAPSKLWPQTAPAAARALLPALADTVHAFSIPPEHLRAVIEGVEMDLHQPQYETFEQLREYCLRVASAVGLACIHVWGFTGPEAFAPAEDCGIALQLTNILRDLREDAETDRVYLPREDLCACGLTPEALLCDTADQRFDELMAMQIARAEEYYRRGAALMGYLEPAGRRAFGMIVATYRALLARIARRPRSVLQGRVHLPRRQKLCIAARWALLPPRDASLA